MKTSTIELPAAAAADKPACPDCGKPMVQRTARKGYFSGKQFWGCSGYPQCKGTRSMEELSSDQSAT